jgi:hypothetical protein
VNQELAGVALGHAEDVDSVIENGVAYRAEIPLGVDEPLFGGVVAEPGLEHHAFAVDRPAFDRAAIGEQALSVSGAFEPPPPSPQLPNNAAAAGAGAGDGAASGDRTSSQAPTSSAGNPSAASDGDGATPLNESNEVSGPQPGLGMAASNVADGFKNAPSPNSLPPPAPPPPSAGVPDDTPDGPWSRGGNEAGSNSLPPPVTPVKDLPDAPPADEEGVGTRAPDSPPPPKPAAPSQAQMDQLARSEQADDDAVAAQKAADDARQATHHVPNAQANADPISGAGTAGNARAQAVLDAAKKGGGSDTP